MITKKISDVSISSSLSLVFRQLREERSCHARIPSGWKDSFQTNRLRHAPSALHQPQRTSSGSVLHHSMWDSFKPACYLYYIGISVSYYNTTFTICMHGITKKPIACPNLQYVVCDVLHLTFHFQSDESNRSDYSLCHVTTMWHTSCVKFNCGIMHFVPCTIFSRQYILKSIP